MSKSEKLIRRLLNKPKDFTWKELVSVLTNLGYQQKSSGKTGGSRVRFLHDSYPPIIIHRPHPSPVLKHYQIDYVISLLKQEELI